MSPHSSHFIHSFIPTHLSSGRIKDQIRETAEIERNSLAVWLMLFSSSCNLLSVRIKDEFLIVSTMAFYYGFCSYPPRLALLFTVWQFVNFHFLIAYITGLFSVCFSLCVS